MVKKATCDVEYFPGNRTNIKTR